MQRPRFRPSSGLISTSRRSRNLYLEWIFPAGTGSRRWMHFRGGWPLTKVKVKKRKEIDTKGGRVWRKTVDASNYFDPGYKIQLNFRNFFMLYPKNSYRKEFTEIITKLPFLLTHFFKQHPFKFNSPDNITFVNYIFKKCSTFTVPFLKLSSHSTSKFKNFLKKKLWKKASCDIIKNKCTYMVQESIEDISIY